MDSFMTAAPYTKTTVLDEATPAQENWRKSIPKGWELMNAKDNRKVTEEKILIQEHDRRCPSWGILCVFLSFILPAVSLPFLCRGLDEIDTGLGCYATMHLLMAPLYLLSTLTICGYVWSVFHHRHLVRNTTKTLVISESQVSMCYPTEPTQSFARNHIRSVFAKRTETLKNEVWTSRYSVHFVMNNTGSSFRADVCLLDGLIREESALFLCHVMGECCVTHISQSVSTTQGDEYDE